MDCSLFARGAGVVVPFCSLFVLFIFMLCRIYESAGNPKIQKACLNYVSGLPFMWMKIMSVLLRNTLALMARDALAILVSTVASESTFTTGGRVLDSFRSSLSARMVEAVICAQDWLRKSHEPLNMEEYVEELENIESEIIGLNEEHPIVDIDG